MRFLADESRDFSVVRALRTAGHDVVSILESARGSTDEDVLARGLREGRIVITEDGDFGNLVFSRGRAHVGVLFLRFPASERAGLASAVVAAASQAGDRLYHAFVVLQPGRVRIAPRPDGSFGETVT